MPRPNTSAFRNKRWKRPIGTKRIKSFDRFGATWTEYRLRNGSAVSVGYAAQCVVKLIAGRYVLTINGKPDVVDYPNALAAMFSCSLQMQAIKQKIIVMEIPADTVTVNAIAAKADTVKRITVKPVTGTAVTVQTDDPHAARRPRVTNVIPLFRNKRPP